MRDVRDEQMLTRGNTEHTSSVTESMLVEMSVAAAQGQDAIQEEMKAFSEQLKPYPWQQLCTYCTLTARLMHAYCTRAVRLIKVYVFTR